MFHPPVSASILHNVYVSSIDEIYTTTKASTQEEGSQSHPIQDGNEDEKSSEINLAPKSLLDEVEQFISYQRFFY